MKKLFLLLAKHLDEMPGIMGEDMEEFMALLNNVLNDPVDLLPLELQCRLIHEEAFRLAIKFGLLKIKRGRIVPNISKTNLLTYLFGRLFSDDYSDVFRGRVLWGCGGEPFPSAELQRYFHVKNLKQMRQNRLGKRVPNGYQLVDKLFDKE